MTFEPTVTLGTILQAVVMVALLLGVYIKIMDRLKDIETKVEVMWRTWLREHIIKDDDRDNYDG